MPTIKIPKLNRQVEVPEGANLMKSLLDAEIPVASSCGGDGICGKCKIEITENSNGLSQETEEETFLKLKLKMDSKLRISCQCQVLESISVNTTYW